MDWDDAKKECCNKYLKLHKLNYTSSDESKLSENESKCGTKRFVTKRLPWEGPRLREIKYLLDLVYRSFNSHVRNFQMQGVVSERFSLRGLSPDDPKWTLKSGLTSVATSTPVRAD